MAVIKSFTFNPFQENTYVVYDETGECVIIDPGCFDAAEKQELKNFIEKEGLKPKHLLNTHCHIDHVLGNRFVSVEWQLPLQIHKKDLPTLQSLPNYAHIFGVGNIEESPAPEIFLEEGQCIRFGTSELSILFVPGHAPGHIAFVNHQDKTLISGDVLFAGSIGRTDLPGGSIEVLMKSIVEKIIPLGNEFKIYSGHGPSTSIGEEMRNNYFLQPEFLERLK